VIAKAFVKAVTSHYAKPKESCKIRTAS